LFSFNKYKIENLMIDQFLISVGYFCIGMCRFCYLCLMRLKDLKMGIMWWLEGLLLLLLEKASQLLLLGSVKHWELFLIKR